MAYQADNPLIVQSDRTVLLEVASPAAEAARQAISPFAELEKSPEHVHTYRITPLSLWNAAVGGLRPQDVLSGLTRYSKYDVPEAVRRDVSELMSRYGRLRLVRDGGELRLVADDPLVLTDLATKPAVQRALGGFIPGPDWLQASQGRLTIAPAERGAVKQALLKLGWPVEDLAGYDPGLPLAVFLRRESGHGRPFHLRPYQEQAVTAFWADGSNRGGSGVVVLPCGAGKTVVGLGTLAAAACHTLVLTTSVTAVRQWLEELLDKTTLGPDQVGEYSGEQKEVRPVTVATYQILTHRSGDTGHLPHLSLLSREDWGLIIYDEVHTLPAPVFRATASIQARRRLGLTATLVREDGREGDVFSLIGPKRFELPWRTLERQGYIAAARCLEVRVDLPADLRLDYAAADTRAKFRLASENPAKDLAVLKLAAHHKGEGVLVIGQYLSQLERLAEALGAPFLQGSTPQAERDRLYAAFRAGEVPVLVVSKVANFAVDLPDASVAIQVSGTFGSRQEEAQRLGRVLRPKADGGPATFYAVVTRETRDQEFAARRQLFLTEQGYDYEIIHLERLAEVLR
ncbi:MAG: DNA repair helicase XPB [Symbiobacteriia bacterium]